MTAHYLLTALQWTCVILGIGAVITLHEWGHFIVAKLCNVRVERFSIGFGPPMIRWRRGETEYWISWIIWGGYVKMTGENPDGADADDPRAFHAQSATKRAAIALAGITMNLLTAFALFTVAFQIGASFPGPVIGGVEESSPAWAGGLRAGDLILSIDGTPVVGFADIAETIAHNDGEDGIEIDFERRGSLDPDGARLLLEEGVWDATGRLSGWRGAAPWTAPLGIIPGDAVQPSDGIQVLLERVAASAGPADLALRRRLRIVPERNDDLGFQTIGIAAGSDLRVAKLVREGGSAPALDAGVLPGDRIVSVDGRPLSSWDEFTDYVRERPGTVLRIDLERRGARRSVQAVPRAQAVWRIGVVLGGPSSEIAQVRPGSIADRIGLQGADRFLDSPLGDADDDEGPTGARVRWDADRTIRILRGEQEVPVRLAPAQGSGPPPPWEEVVEGILWAPTVSGVAQGGVAAQAGLQPGDRIQRAWIGDAEDPVPVRLWSDIPVLVSRASGRSLRLEVRRGAGVDTITMSARRDEAHPIGVLGIVPADRLVMQRIANPWHAFQYGIRRCWIEIRKIPRFIVRLFDRSDRSIDVKNLAGPIAIAQVASRFADWGIGSFIYFFGFVSVQLAVLNLLPIPVLDGGHLLYLALEKIKGGRLSDRAQAIGQYIGLSLLLPLMALVFYNDIARLISRWLGGS